MHYKTNRQNHDFQIAYFLVGSCQTADAAYGLLHDLRQDREAALAMAKATELKARAARHRAEQTLIDSTDEADRLEAQAVLLEHQAVSEINESNINACADEVKFIHECIRRIEPLRKFKHLPDREAFEAAQAEEWRLTLMRRAENYLVTQGTIPHDHFEAMRQHPAFAASILPHMERVMEIARNRDKLLEFVREQERVLEPLRLAIKGVDSLALAE